MISNFKAVRIIVFLKEHPADSVMMIKEVYEFDADRVWRKDGTFMAQFARTLKDAFQDVSCAPPGMMKVSIEPVWKEGME